MDTLPGSAAEASHFIWTVSLILGLVVALVVTVLLLLIHSTAARINDCVSGIWDTGQRVANNTIHIPALKRTNAVAGKILQTALRINDGAAAIEKHASTCRGCPHCML